MRNSNYLRDTEKWIHVPDDDLFHPSHKAAFIAAVLIALVSTLTGMFVLIVLARLLL